MTPRHSSEKKWPLTPMYMVQEKCGQLITMHSAKCHHLQMFLRFFQRRQPFSSFFIQRNRSLRLVLYLQLFK
ncbi:hypothetical protein XENTR_v10024660 [Xenopus tropicalis]|nr:hypothetical protein XENTR_v10024660 [Xenopus tropicalis]